MHDGALSDEEKVNGEAANETLYSENQGREELAGKELCSENIIVDEKIIENEKITGEVLHSQEPVKEDTAGEPPLHGEESAGKPPLHGEESAGERFANGNPAGKGPVTEARTSDGAGHEKLEWNKPEEPEEPVIPSKAAASAAPRRQAPFSPTTGPVPERRPLPRQFMTGWRQRNQPQATRTMPTGQPQPAAQEIPPTGQPRPAAPKIPPAGRSQSRPAAPGTPPAIQPLPHVTAAGPSFTARRPLPYSPAPAPAPAGQSPLNRQNAAQESRRNEASEAQVEGTGSSQHAEMTFSEPSIPQSGRDIAGSTVCYQADAAVKEAPASGKAAPPLGNPQELERLLKAEDSDEVPHDLIWEKLKHEHTRILAFDYEDGCEILTIKPQDIGILPRETWVFGNNSFLLHGYYNYRYLILAKLFNPQGDPRYILGIPGHFYSNERYMASMFGFPNFVLSKEQPAEDGRFGFWYTDIKLGG